MNSATAALLALVLVCSLPALALAAGESGTLADGSPTDTTGPASLEVSQHGEAFMELEGTTNRQLLDSDADIRRGYHAPSVDFAATAKQADDELRVDYERHAFERAFASADDDDERAAVIEAYLDTIDDHIEALHDREEDAVAAHADGEMTDRELLNTLIRNYETANQVGLSLAELESEAATVPGYSIDVGEERALMNRLDAHRSALRGNLAASVNADSDRSVTVETTEAGYRLSMMSNQNYYSEVVRFDHRDIDGEDRIGSASAANDYGEELYPHAIDTSSGISVESIIHTNLYRTQIDHEQGSLDAYIDGSTERVTRETQQLSTPTLPIDQEDTWTEDDLEVTLERTPGHGPAQVNVTDADTGESVQATISLDGEPIGETDEDGTHWIAQPMGAYDLAVESDEHEVAVTVED